MRGGSMVDGVVLNKAASIERCVARAREEYFGDPEGFADDFTPQDAAIHNIQRTCEAALDVGHHLVRRERLGVPQGARDVFTLLSPGRVDRRVVGRISSADGGLP